MLWARRFTVCFSSLTVLLLSLIFRVHFLKMLQIELEHVFRIFFFFSVWHRKRDSSILLFDGILAVVRLVCRYTQTNRKFLTLFNHIRVCTKCYRSAMQKRFKNRVWLWNQMWACDVCVRSFLSLNWFQFEHVNAVVRSESSSTSSLFSREKEITKNSQWQYTCHALHTRGNVRYKFTWIFQH